MNNKFLIKNVNLRKFEKIINTNLIVRNNLMLEFSSHFIRSCAVNNTMSMMKLFTVEIDKISMEPEPQTQQAISLDVLAEKPATSNNNITEVFDFYLLRGEILKNNFGIFDQNQPVNIEFDVIKTPESERLRATNMKITGVSKFKTKLETTLPLTDEPLNSESVKDYSSTMQLVTPDENSHSFTLTPEMFTEISSMIKTLNKTIVNNTIYIDVEVYGNQIVFKDRAFKVEYILPEPIEGEISFKISKNDWIKLTGVNPITIFLNKNADDNKIIFATKFIDAVIFSLITKVKGGADYAESNDMDSDLDGALDNLDLDLDAYGMDDFN